MTISESYTASEVLLRDVCALVDYGYTASSSEEPIGPKFLRITDIVPDLIDWDSVPHCAIEERKLDKFRLERGDIVIARTGATTGYGKWIKDPHGAVFASYLVRLRVIPAVDSRFIGYIVESEDYKKFIEVHRGGAAQPNANAQVLTSYPIRLPSLTVQRRVSEALSAFDSLIENNTRRIVILEEMAQAVYREWFVNFRFPGHEQVEMVESELGPVPAGWAVLSFSAIANFINGFAFKPQHFEQTGKPIVKIAELKNGVSAKTPFNSGETIPAKFHVGSGDLLFSWSADLDAYIWSHGDGLLNQHLFNVVPADGYSRLFLFHSLKARMREFRIRSQGTTMRHIKRSALDEVKVVVPPLALRNTFDEHAQPLSSMVINLSSRNQILRESRDLLLPRLISGEIEVAAMEDELAGAAA